MNGTSSISQNSTNLTYDNGNLSSILLWHARFGHIKYDSLKIVKHEGLQGIPTIPGQLSHICNSCILGTHSEHHFP